MGSFEHLLTPIASAPGCVTFTVTKDWLQGKAIFGGILTAMAHESLSSLVATERTPRTITTTFLSRVSPGTVEVRTELLRDGRQLSLAEARIYQSGELCAVVSEVFGGSRSSTLRVAPPQRPERRGPECIEPLPYVPGVIPEFTKNFAYHFTDGSFPFSGYIEGVIGGWCQHKTTATRGVSGMLGLIDAWPPSVLPMAERPVPASSITWTVHLVETPATLPEGWCWFRAETVQSEGGFATSLGYFYLPDGRLGAWSEQLVAVFDA